MAPYSSCLLRVMVGFIPCSIALRVAQMEANHTKVSPLDAEGNLYGTAVTGGSGSCEGGCGVLTS